MAEILLGSWQLVSSEGFDGYLKELGMSAAYRKIVCSLKPDVIISKNEDQWCIKTVSKFKTATIDFKLNEVLDGTTTDDRECKFIFTLDENGLKETQRWQDKETTITRRVENGEMITECICGKERCIRIYKKK